MSDIDPSTRRTTPGPHPTRTVGGAGMRNAIERCSSSAPSRSIPAMPLASFRSSIGARWNCGAANRSSGDTDKRFCGSFKLFRPDGTYMPHDQCPMAEVVAGTLSEACRRGSAHRAARRLADHRHREYPAAEESTRRRHRRHQLFLRHHIAQADRGRPAPEPRGRHADAAGQYAPAPGRRFFAAAARHPGCRHRDHRRPDGKHPVARG